MMSIAEKKIKKEPNNRDTYDQGQIYLGLSELESGSSQHHGPPQTGPNQTHLHAKLLNAWARLGEERLVIGLGSVVARFKGSFLGVQSINPVAVSVHFIV